MENVGEIKLGMREPRGKPQKIPILPTKIVPWRHETRTLDLSMDRRAVQPLVGRDTSGYL